MTREQKIAKRKARKQLRIAKRNTKFQRSGLVRRMNAGCSVGEARRIDRNGYFIDSSGREMQVCSYDAWGTCSYPCNGDC